MYESTGLKRNLRTILLGYLRANGKYEKNGSAFFENEMTKSKQEFLSVVLKYTESASDLENKNIMDEYHKALDFYNKTDKEYAPIAKDTFDNTLMPGNNPLLVLCHKSHAVSDRFELAEEWLRLLRKLLISKNLTI